MPRKLSLMNACLPWQYDGLGVSQFTKAVTLCLFVFLQFGCVNGLVTKSVSTPSNLLSNISNVAPANADLSPKDSALACLKTAQQLDNQHHFREAIALYERARGFDPKLENVSRRLAVLYAQTKDIAKAKVEFEKAIAEAPKDGLLRSDAGYFFLQSGELENAEAQLVAARDLSKNSPKATIHLAMLRAKQERLDESLTLFEEAVGPASARSNLGVLLAKAGKHELAIQYLEEANRLDPSLPIPPAFLKQLRKN